MWLLLDSVSQKCSYKSRTVGGYHIIVRHNDNLCVPLVLALKGSALCITAENRIEQDATAYLKLCLILRTNSDNFPHSTKSLVFVVKEKCAFFEVETELLYIPFI
jgi:hypothetical protein